MAEANPKSDKWDIVDAVYSDEFLAELGAEFKFDALAPKMASEIRVVGWRYLVEQAIDNDDSAMRRQARREFQALKKQIDDFAELLLRPEYADIASDIYFAALRLREPAPKTHFPQLTEFEKTRGAPYLAELVRLLRLLDAAAEDGIKCFSPPKGRKKKYAVENFARRSAYIWKDMLGQPFTIDYHEGAGLTRAFEFVKALLNRIDVSVSDTAIITGMRATIAQNREFELSKPNSSE
jgi:hypothetical protein